MPNRPTGPSRRNASWSLVCLLALLWLPVPASAQSEVDADFQAYCRTRHSGSLYQRTGNDHFCRRGRRSRASTWPRRAASPRATGSTAVWIGGYCARPVERPVRARPRRPASRWGPRTFRRYCSEKFPNSGYEKRNESWGVVHYCRRAGATGGYSLQQIDLTDACRLIRNADSYEMDGNRVRCRRGAGIRRARPCRAPSPFRPAQDYPVRPRADGGRGVSVPRRQVAQRHDPHGGEDRVGHAGDDGES